MRAVLHVGFHKTGSSSIQDTLAQVSDPGFVYLTDDPANHSFLIQQAYGSIRHDMDGSPQYRAAFRKRLMAASRSGGDKTLVISAESIPSTPPVGLEALKADIQDVATMPQVIGYIRPVADFLASSFQQKLKQASIPLAEHTMRNYFRQVEAIDTAFGRENVTLLPFDRKLLSGGDVVLDFCHRIGLPLDPSQIVTSNESIGAEGTALLYIHRKWHKDAKQMRSGRPQRDQAFIDHLRLAGDGKLVLDGSVVAAANSKMLANLRKVSERIGYPFEKFLDCSRSGIRTEDELLAKVLSAEYQETMLPRLTGTAFTGRLDEQQLAQALERLRLRLTGSGEGVGAAGKGQNTLLGTIRRKIGRLF